MSKREELKQGHEKAVVDQLLAAEGINASFERVGDPNKHEPDVLYKVEASAIGVEVATAYYDEANAQDEWKTATGEHPLAPDEIRPNATGIMGDPDQMICERIQEELDDKCSKEYTGVDETWLCINMIAALSDAKAVAECVKELKIPAGHKFERIYISYTAPEQEGGKYTATRIA